MELGAMHKCVIFLIAVIACSHLVLSVEGRQLKSVNDSKQSSKTDNFAISKEDLQPGAPGYIPNAGHHSVSGKKEVLPPAIPTRSSDFGDSITGYKDDFRPTTPGNSPGVGHSFEEDDEDTVQKPGSISSSNNKHSIAEEKEDLQTTSPGHSPGVGHAFPNETSEPNA